MSKRVACAMIRSWVFGPLLNFRRGVMETNPRGQLVLVVEDHEDTQSCVAEQLADYGFEVLTASDGESALSLIRERHPALVYLDMMLPNVSGYDVCEEIRADPSL